MLESKWPSSDTNAFLLWTKLRNVIMATAQFKQGLRRRRLSMYSTSESDFDRISRTSTDSFVDEITADRVDGAKTEFVNDLVSVESPNIEERTSTGGLAIGDDRHRWVGRLVGGLLGMISVGGWATIGKHGWVGWWVGYWG